MNSIQIIILIFIALVLFATEYLRPDIIALIVLLILIFTNTITVDEGFSGFSNPAVITVISMFILSAGLVKAGIADKIAEALLRLGGKNPVILTALVMLTVGLMSAFMNNIGATAILISSIFSISERINYPASKLLIPLSFGSLLGGLTTVIGTPPNLLVSTALENAGYEGFRLFDFLPTGLSIMSLAIIYFVVIGRFLLPERKILGNYVKTFQLKGYVSEVLIPNNSSLVGKSLIQSGLKEKFEITVICIHRERNGRSHEILPEPATIIQPLDKLLVKGDLKKLFNHYQEIQFAVPSSVSSDERELIGSNTILAEAAIAPGAEILGKTIKEIDLRKRFEVFALGLKRFDKIVNKFTNLRLQVGDVLLVQGTDASISNLARNRNFLVVNSLDHEKRNLKKAPIALIIMFGIILAAATGFLHISVAGLTGVVLMVLSGCLFPIEIYKAVEWRVIFLIAGMLPLGIAMDEQHSGTAEFLAGLLVEYTGGSGPIYLLAGLFLFTTLITEVMSNAAAAVLLAPIGISVAVSMNLQPHPFLIAIAIGASTTFLTPIGHQVNVLVYGIGNYKFSDFIKVGFLLNVIIFIAVIFLIPLFWPFENIK